MNQASPRCVPGAEMAALGGQVSRLQWLPVGLQRRARVRVRRLAGVDPREEEEDEGAPKQLEVHDNVEYMFKLIFE